MRYTARTGVMGLVCCVLLSACHDGGGPTESIVPPNGTRIDLASPSNSCKPPKVHPAGKILGTVSAPSPWDVAVRDDGAAYFTELFNNGVGITNTTTRTITGFIPTGYLPTGIALSSDGTRIYTANQGDNTVTAIDAVNNVVIGTVSIGGSSPFSVEVSPDNTQLFVGNNDNTLSIVDVATLQITKTVFIGFATNAFAVDPTGRFLYANSFVSASVSEIDIVTGNVVRTFSLGGTTQGMALNKKGTHLFVANEAGYISDVDLRSGLQAAQYPIAGVGFGVGVTPDDHDAWITLPLDGKVQVFNLTTHRVSATLDVGGNPRRVSFSDAGKIGAITNQAGYITFVQ